MNCQRCGAARGVLAITSSRLHNRMWHYRDREPEWVWVRFTRARCWDREACEARYEKRRQRGAQRRGVLVLAEPKAPLAPRGTCAWCGDPILKPDGTPDRRRNYHDDKVQPTRGNGWVTSVREPAEPPCRREWMSSRVWSGRDALRALARRAGVPLRCVDCGFEVDGPGQPAWEADHDVPLEDGGEHTLENLRCRCVDCHRAKTGRENAARRASGRAATLRA